MSWEVRSSCGVLYNTIAYVRCFKSNSYSEVHKHLFAKFNNHNELVMDKKYILHLYVSCRLLGIQVHGAKNYSNSVCNVMH
jgi:hypothetical protein